jgi:hypothetical protein
MSPIPGVIASAHVTTAAQAVRFDATADKYTRTANGLAGAFTWTWWVKLASDRNTYSLMVCQDNASSTYYMMGTNVNGTTFSRSSVTNSASHSFDFTVGTWTFCAAVNNTSGGDNIIGTHPVGGSWTALAAPGATTGPSDSNTFTIGQNGFGSQWVDGSIAAVKVWSVALTAAECQAERNFYAPVKTSGLWASYSFRNGPQTNDESGNGRTLTAAGTLTTDSSGPPIT